MFIVGADYHPGFQQIAFVDTEMEKAVNLCSFSFSDDSMILMFSCFAEDPGEGIYKPVNH